MRHAGRKLHDSEGLLDETGSLGGAGHGHLRRPRPIFADVLGQSSSRLDAGQRPKEGLEGIPASGANAERIRQALNAASP
jgi:hypothetical protein